jgi:LEA14-like dessication related protein
MKKIINCLLILLVLSTFTACFSYKELQVKEVQSVKLLGMNDSIADVQIAVKVRNPNKMKIILKDNDLNASVNNKLIGKVSFDKNLVIPKKSEQTYYLVLKADMHEVKKLMPSLLFTNKAIIGLTGNVKAKAKGISKNIPVAVNQKISRNDLKCIMASGSK